MTRWPTALERVGQRDTTPGNEDVDPSIEAIMVRAREALLGACDGWREHRRCTASDGTRVVHPHPECLAAQYRHEVILLENGLPR